MEQSPDAFNEAELYAMLDAQPAMDAQAERENLAYERAYTTVWHAVDTLPGITLAIGRDTTTCAAAISLLHRYYLEGIHALEGVPSNPEIREAQSDAAMNMAAVRCTEDMAIIEALIGLRAEGYLDEDGALGTDQTRKRLIAERYASREDAEAITRLLITDPDYIPDADVEADQWIAIINSAFDGEPFDYTNPNDIALILDALYEPAEASDGPRIQLFNHLLDSFEDSIEIFNQVYKNQGQVIAHTLADQLLQIACACDADPNFARQDELIDNLLRNIPDLTLMSNETKALISSYRGQLSDNPD